ncbi:nuclear transport factor 2 family protein [Ruegeria profundi]|uniref:nuclear transport factor 2 family protein n=1 Tax=Ruegeria profundi TaxID=1685378 RepID=UPI001CD63FAD|nr:nuclear transport factor 2 family protein [Ruegeria profundi]MCA0929794.1 nuclear transport factor 2 family protein [Ruegeria profundi]
MSTQSNVETMRKAFTEWNDCKASDIRMWEKYTTTDLRLRSLGQGQNRLDFSRARDGQTQMLEYLTELTTAFEMQHWTLKDTIAQDDRVVGIGVCAWRHRGTGKTIETPIVIICRFHDGRICEYDEFYDTAAVSAAMS